MVPCAPLLDRFVITYRFNKGWEGRCNSRTKSVSARVTEPCSGLPLCHRSKILAVLHPKFGIAEPDLPVRVLEGSPDQFVAAGIMQEGEAFEAGSADSH